ncbi:MAG: DUF3021 family protein [Firmicutes bacterium]|nr:DUF3021 family protein [Bacillota bacterium]
MDTFKRMVTNIIFIFGVAVLAMYIDRLVFSGNIIEVSTLTGLLAISILASFLPLIFYSKKELTRRQMLVRSGIHTLAILVVVLLVATIMGWIIWTEPFRIIVLTGLVIIMCVFTGLLAERKSKKLADELNEKLKERYK